MLQLQPIAELTSACYVVDQAWRREKKLRYFPRTISSRISPHHSDLLLLFTLLPSVVTLFSQRLERNIHRVMRKNWCFRFDAEVSMLIFLSSEWFFQFSFGSVSISRRVECQKCVNWLWITALSSDIKLFSWVDFKWLISRGNSSFAVDAMTQWDRWTSTRKMSNSARAFVFSCDIETESLEHKRIQKKNRNFEFFRLHVLLWLSETRKSEFNEINGWTS